MISPILLKQRLKLGKTHIFLLISLGIALSTIIFFNSKQELTLAQDVNTDTSIPKVGQEQFIIKIRSEKINNNPQGNKEEIVKTIVNKYAKTKTVRSELENARKLLEKKSTPKNSEKLNYIYSIEVDEEKSNLKNILVKLKQDPDIEIAQWNYLYEPDFIPNDPSYNSQWSHPKTQITSAWDISTGNPNVIIALIGTGVKWDHEDLAANIWSNSDEIAGNGIDDDSNGYIDDIRGWNFEQLNNNPTDNNGHETSVAGIAAAVTNNSIGVAGVCPQCKIMPLRVLYTTAQVADAIYYAVGNGAKIVNMSFGNYDIAKYGTDSIVNTAINFGTSNNVLMVATAGNDSTNTKRYPGALEDVIGVASTDSIDSRSGFSNWGEWVDMAAPGTSVASTTLAGYGNVSGTSFSAPYVAGIAGLIFSKNPALSLTDARLILEYTVSKIAVDKFIGSGRINSQNAVLANSRPTLFSIIKSPANNFLSPEAGIIQFSGTALGNSYILEYQSDGATWIQFAAGSETINGALGQLDITPFTPGGLISIRLTSKYGTSTDTHTVSLIKGGGFSTGFPLQLSGGPIFSGARVIDIDNDGDLEIVIGSQSKLFVINHNGTLLPGWPQNLPSVYGYAAPAIGDIDGNGDLEIAIATYGGSTSGGHLAIWNHDGTVYPGFPKVIGQTRGAVTLANLDTDPQPEIILGSAGVSTASALIYAWNADGTAVPNWPYSLPESNMQASVSVGDIDNNGANEIVMSSSSYTVIVKNNASFVNSWKKTSGSHGNPVLSDINGDGDLEIITPESSSLKAWNHSSKSPNLLIWSVPIISDGYNQASSANIIGSDLPEILYAGTGSVNSNIYIWSPSGNLLTGWPKQISGKVGGEPTVGDINGDGVPEIVIGSSDGKIYAWNNAGELITGFPKSAGSGIYREITISDLNQDGKTELITGTEDGRLFVWDLQTPYNQSAQLWPITRQNLQNTGVSIQSPILTPTATLTPTPTSSAGDVIFPTVTITSPLNNSTVIKNKIVSIKATATDNVSVSKVEFLVNNALICTDSKSPYSCSWSVPNQAGLIFTITARAYDTSNNATSASIQVTSK